MVERVLEGDTGSLGELLETYRGRLRRLVALRLDHRLRGRVDPSDVLQEAFLEAAVNLPSHVHAPRLGFFVWLRLVVGQRLQIVHRHHLGVKARDARRDVSIDARGPINASSAMPAAQFLGQNSTPSASFARQERKARLHHALGQLRPLDREVLKLRHFDQLSMAETARIMGGTQDAVARRYFRALKHLRQIMATMPGGVEEFLP